MNVAVIIQARMTSTRLPGKVMMPLCNKPVLEHIINRLSMSKHNIKIIIATTTNEQDDIVADFSMTKGIGVFRGSETDVLERYYLAAKKYAADIIVRITSDCPLYEVSILDKMLDEYFEKGVDYFSNVIERTFPRGLDTEIFSFSTLERAYNEAVAQECREHVTPYIYQNPQWFTLANYSCEENMSQYRWTLDTKEDYELITQIYETLYPRNKYFGVDDILKAYSTYPEWLMINKEVEQKKVGYKGV